ncbi:SGNH/GDSL hydrolase family protein [Mucilaginibacter sp. McL0603]|uniref:SGNH/GDSL hydrolase family protein n=1 Tax=Mucilaginibacter sp. McL0603 TaxID=3415670 RepID=UPI003CEAECBD
MTRRFSILLLILSINIAFAKPKKPALNLYKANNTNIQYFGRIDFSDPLKPRFWSPGVYIKAKFKGTDCELVINDEILGGDNHNYIEIAIDNNAPVRIKLTDKQNIIKAAQGLADTEHIITICKDTESGIGYLEFVGIKCDKMLSLPSKPKRKIEYIGDSITAGTGMDLSVIPCDEGQWYDQHNAYMSYGPVTSRALDAQWQLTAVAGIGLTHSCCNMDILMPDVLDKMYLRNNKMQWDFSRYQPDVVTICLGQNDGVVDSTLFCSAYVKFINTVRMHYPKADIICLTSPMANITLNVVLRKYLSGIAAYMNAQGDKKVYKYFFSKRYHNGCGGHPDMAEHMQIADELTAYIKQVEGW